MPDKKLELTKRGAEAFDTVLLASAAYIRDYKHLSDNKPDMFLAAMVIYTKRMKIRNTLKGVPKPFETPKPKIKFSFTYVECAAFLHFFSNVPFPNNDPMSPVVGQSFFLYAQNALAHACP
jgi:hypothetical protein